MVDEARVISVLSAEGPLAERIKIRWKSRYHGLETQLMFIYSEDPIEEGWKVDDSLWGYASPHSETYILLEESMVPPISRQVIEECLA